VSETSLRRATWLVVASLAVLPLWLPITAAFPRGTRPAVFLVGVAGTSALALAGGIRARRALLAETPHQARAVVVAWTGLLIGVVAGVFCVWTAIGLLA
jgi:hypothetical protein